MTKIVMLSGKGGVGKTTITALLIDELARSGYQGKVLAVDGDPAMTLNIALNFPDPKTTVADVRDSAQLSGQDLAKIPEGVSRDAFLKGRMKSEGVLSDYTLHGMPVTLMPMGRGEGKHCYCSVNSTLSLALKEVMDDYDLIVIDNEAGLEHLSRYRVDRADYFIVVAGRDKASQVVARRVFDVANEVGMRIDKQAIFLNKSDPNQLDSTDKVVKLPRDEHLASGASVAVELPVNAPLRIALTPIAREIKDMVNVREPMPSA